MGWLLLVVLVVVGWGSLAVVGLGWILGSYALVLPMVVLVMASMLMVLLIVAIIVVVELLVSPLLSTVLIVEHSILFSLSSVVPCLVRVLIPILVGLVDQSRVNVEDSLDHSDHIFSLEEPSLNLVDFIVINLSPGK